MEQHIHGVRVKCYFYVYIRYSLHKQRCRCVGVEDQKFLLTALLTLLTKSYISVASANRHLRGAVLARYCFVKDRIFSRRNRGVNMNVWLWINLPSWCNIYCIISARHVSGLYTYAHLQEQVDVIISYIYSIWCPWCSRCRSRGECVLVVCCTAVPCNTPPAHTLLKTDT